MLSSGFIGWFYLFLSTMAGLFFSLQFILAVFKWRKVNSSRFLKIPAFLFLMRWLSKPGVFLLFSFCLMDLIVSPFAILHFRPFAGVFERLLDRQWLIIPVSVVMTVAYFYALQGQRLTLGLGEKISLTFDANETLGFHIGRMEKEENPALIYFALPKTVQKIRDSGVTQELHIGTWAFATDLRPDRLSKLQAHLRWVGLDATWLRCECRGPNTCTCSRSRKVAYRVCRYVLLPFRLVSALINWLPVAWHMWHLGPPPAAPQGLLKRLISRSLSPFNATSTYQKLNVHILLILAVGYPDKVDLLTGYKAQVVIPKTTVEWCSAPPDAAQEAIIS